VPPPLLLLLPQSDRLSQRQRQLCHRLTRREESQPPRSAQADAAFVDAIAKSAPTLRPE
jgi:hypothetical protein